LLLDDTRPRSSDFDLCVDEQVVAALRKALHKIRGKPFIRIGAPLVADKCLRHSIRLRIEKIAPPVLSQEARNRLPLSGLIKFMAMAPFPFLCLKAPCGCTPRQSR